MPHDPVDLIAVQLASLEAGERISFVATLLKKCLGIDVVDMTDEAQDDFDSGLTEFLNDFIGNYGREGVRVAED